MDQLIAGGVHGAVVLNLAPRGPLHGALADDPVFFSEPWWDVFLGVCRDAASRDFRIWFYDQLGFSGADVQGRLVQDRPGCRGRSLRRHHEVLTSPGTVAVPEGSEALAAWAVPLDGRDDPCGWPIALEFGEEGARLDRDGRHRVSLAHVVARGFDYLSPDACRWLLDAVHGEFERRAGDFFGSTIVGSFQDELPSMPSWSATFPDEFAARCGYRLEGHLDALWELDVTDGEQVRRDYQHTRAALAEEAFFRPLFDWHDHRGLLVGCDQQHPARAGYPVEATQQYGDYLRTHRWFSAPGSDHWGDAKVHSSLAHLHGRPRTWLEAFHSTGWGGTLEETWDWLLPWLRAGANLYSPHAVYYSTHGATWEWAAPSTCWRQPYWRHHRLFAQAVTRLCAALTWGRHVCDVAVLYPTATVQASVPLELSEELFGQPAGNCPAHDHYLDIVGRMHWFEPAPGALDRDGRDFDVVDDDSVVAGEVIDGRLRAGDESYRALVLPGCRVMEAATLRAVIALARAGGVVVAVGELPGVVVGDGDGTGAADLSAFALLVGEQVIRHVPAASGLVAALAAVPRTVTSDAPTLLRVDDDSAVLFVIASELGATRKGPGRSWLTDGYTFDPARQPDQATVTVTGLPLPVAAWDPGTGTSVRLEGRHKGEACTITVPLDAGPCTLLVFGRAAQDVLNGDEQTIRMAWTGPALGTFSSEVVVPSGSWTATMVPTLDNTFGDHAHPASTGLLEVAIHSIEQLSSGDLANDEVPDAEAGTWLPVRPTFGPWGVALGPRPAADLPPPGTAPRSAAVDGWCPIVHSQVAETPREPETGDPKGYVPEAFLDFGTLEADDGVQTQFVVSVERPMVGHLTVGASADVTVWCNAKPVATTGSIYHRDAEVHLVAGDNLLEIRFVAPSRRRLRASWTLRDVPDREPRPQWLTARDAPADTAEVTVLRAPALELAARPARALLQFGSIGDAQLLVNGDVVARHGEFDNYAHVLVPRVRVYDVTSAFRAGRNDLEIHLGESGAAAVLDAELVVGEVTQLFVTDDGWSAARGGAPVTLIGPAEVPHDPRWVQLSPRSHPLRHGGHLQDLPEDPHVLVPRGPDAGMGDVPDGSANQWYRFALPPGARAVRVDVHGSPTLFLDGTPLEVAADGHRLPAGVAGGTPCLVRVAPDAAVSGGAVFLGPILVTEFGAGPLALGDWQEHGLRDHSGAVRYRTEVHLHFDAQVLDLGDMRGTAEVWVNGLSAGVRIWSPWRFDVAGLCSHGVNTIEVEVSNTLAPHQAAAGPTAAVLPGQTRSGLFGPVRLLS